jgi:hypothetical protein
MAVAPPTLLAPPDCGPPPLVVASWFLVSLEPQPAARSRHALVSKQLVAWSRDVMFVPLLAEADAVSGSLH